MIVNRQKLSKCLGPKIFRFVVFYLLETLGHFSILFKAKITSDSHNFLENKRKLTSINSINPIKHNDT